MTYQNEEQLQKDHFNRIASNYRRHYGDRWSQKYRHHFLNDPMFKEINLAGKTVLDAICGNGETTEYLLEKGALVTGLDISQKAIKNYREKWPECATKCASILATGFPDNNFDCLVVVGGLHHLHPYILEAVNEIHRIIKPGGYFCFTEPHQGSLPDKIRQFWYKRDSLFANNEKAVDVDELKIHYQNKFIFRKQYYTGNAAYLLVLNSMIFRMPLQIKAVYAPLLLKVETVLGRLQGKKLSCVSVCQWQKR